MRSYIFALVLVGAIAGVAGADLMLSDPVTIRIQNSDGGTDSPSNHSPTTVDSLAVASTSPSTGIRRATVDGRTASTGIDNVKVSIVPSPTAVFLGLLGLSVVGIKLRKLA